MAYGVVALDAALIGEPIDPDWAAAGLTKLVFFGLVNPLPDPDDADAAPLPTRPVAGLPSTGATSS